MRGDVIDRRSVQAEQILIGVVGILVYVPVRIYIIGVHAVPVGIFSVGILICTQPALVVGGCKSHEILADIRLAVAQSRTVLYILVGIVYGEVKVDSAQRRIGPQVEDVTAHVSFGHNILVAHIGESEAYACVARVRRYCDSVVGRKTGSEESGCIVRDYKIRTLNAVEVAKHVASVGFRAPALVGV